MGGSVLCAAGEDWSEAITQDLSPMHILTPLTVTLNVYKCMVTDTTLPKYEHQFLISHLCRPVAPFIHILYNAPGVG